MKTLPDSIEGLIKLGQGKLLPPGYRGSMPAPRHPSYGPDVTPPWRITGPLIVTAIAAGWSAGMIALGIAIARWW